ncbi:choice-of-anchor M domain-containing protein [Cutibacterium equinum]|uniref:choice-of-anchor M domain-containing protein n=1 Tax=Cutibacterium equinum TaxID=3016342 RepID=UPI002FE0DD6D
MQTKKNHVRPVALAVLMTLLASVFAPMSWAADAKVVLREDHTDAFFIDTDTGVPVVQVENGLRSQKYDPNDVEFQIQPDTYGKYELKGVSESPLEGYYTGSEDADIWFEPGWNAPRFAKNGFDALRVDFTTVTGPGKMLLTGNSPEGDDDGPLGAWLADGTYELVKGASLPIKGHQHAHWLFTRAGKYTMSGVAVGTKTDGTEVSSQPFTLSWDILKSDDDTRPADTADPTPTVTPSATPTPTDTPSAVPTPEPTETAGPTIDTTKIEIDHGHLDVFAGLAHDGMLSMAIKDDRDGDAVYRAPEAVTLKIGENAFRKLPETMHDRFAPEGYVLAQNGEHQQEMLFPGWDTFGVAPDFEAVDLEFVDVTGPGKVYLYQQGIGKLHSPLVSGSWVLASGETISQKKLGHVHTNWLFEKPGTYTMKVRLKGVPVKATDGKAVVSEPATYTWVVGDKQDDQPVVAPTNPVPSEAPSSPAAGPTDQPSAVPSSPAASVVPSSPVPSSPAAGPTDQPSVVPSQAPSVVPTSQASEGAGEGAVQPTPTQGADVPSVTSSQAPAVKASALPHTGV